MLKNRNGFTLIELMIVVVIIGILTAIAIPNFVEMQARAREASVKANMHSFQLAVEDFAVKNTGTVEDFSVKNTGTYPVAADDAAVMANMPSGNYPRNPFSGFNDAWTWGADPAAPGIIGVNPATTTTYVIKGYGRSGLIALLLTNG